MIKNILIALIAITSFGSSSIAIEEAAVTKYVHSLVLDTINILNDSNMDAKKKSSKVRESLGSNLDSAWMGKFVLGRGVKTLPQDQLQKFIATYHKYLVQSYTKAVSGYKGEKVNIISLDTLSDGFFIVKTQVIKVGGNSINIEYLAREVEGKYKVCDVITEGISLINSQRSEYSGIIESEGIDHLIVELAKRTKE